MAEAATTSAALRVTAAARTRQSLENTPLTISIDASPQAAVWGVNEFAVEPGDHVVNIWFRYCWGARGRVQRRVRAEPGGVVELVYRSPYFMFFSRGELTEAPPAATAADPRS